MSRCLPVSTLAFLLLAAPAAAAEEFADIATPFLKQHCLACHGEKKQEGGVRLDQVAGRDVEYESYKRGELDGRIA